MPGEKEDVSWGVYPIMGRDGLYVRWNGGGGYGDPMQRDAEAVAADVGKGVVSQWTSRAVYGVVIDEATGAIDPGATETARAAMRESRRERQAAE
jgi:N-methylhydantoinase B